MNLSELLAKIRDDLPAIADNLRWAHTHGHYAETRDHDAPTARVAPPPDDQRPDHIRAARHDLGIGDHRTRVAYQQALHHLRRAETALRLAVHLTGQAQPRRALGHEHPTLHDALTAIHRARTRCQLLEHTDTHIRRADIRRAVRAAAHEVDQAWWKLTGAFQIGAANPDTHATGEPMCRICEIRPRAEKTGGRCNTCATWRARNKTERPKKLDGVREAHDAKHRRAARGEGWGTA